MVKIIGVLLIVSSMLLLIADTFIDSKYGSATHITGNVVSNIVTQPNVTIGFFDYLEGIIYSASFISLIMGAIFLFRV